MKEESEKVGLKLNIQKTKIMASSPITSWQIDAETVDLYKIVDQFKIKLTHERLMGNLQWRGQPLTT